MKSGYVSDIGTEYSRAFEMALKNYPNPVIKPVIVDGGSNGSTASAAWATLMNSTPDLPIVVTVASWTTNIVYPGAADRGMVQVALGSAAVNRSRSSDQLIRFTPGVEQESPHLAKFLSHFDRVALIGGENDYTNGYFSALDTLLPGKICLKSYYDANNLPSSLNITRITGSNPDVIVLLGFSEGAQAASLIRKGGITVPLVGTRGIETNLLARSPASEGLIFTTPALNETHPFFSDYADEFGENATFYGAEGYDAMTTLSDAVSECRGDQDCMYSWYQNRSYEGALGQIIFDDNGVASYPIELKNVREGKFVDYLDPRTISADYRTGNNTACGISAGLTPEILS
jgi:ABC-type branched-subunit amino acid transport system substrate-binding protein